ncbi:hypothetical protein FOCC_FOCC014230 [Frankliniella occidentalis]|nr:hypothetical protein FOCC_FOCC014230 [Frankliniella occidentalis]
MGDEEKSSRESNKWLVVRCDEDSSFSLIEKKEAVFDDEHLSTGDKLKFFYNNKEYDGEVCAMGGDDDYDGLVVKLNELNASNRIKRELSFHADKPRRGRGKGLEAVLSTLKSRRVKKSTQDEETNNNSTNRADVTKPKSGSDSSGSSSRTGSATSSRSSSPLPEERSSSDVRNASQVKRKAVDNDLKLLKKLRHASPEQASELMKRPVTGCVILSNNVDGVDMDDLKDTGTTSETGMNGVSEVKSSGDISIVNQVLEMDDKMEDVREEAEKEKIKDKAKKKEESKKKKEVKEEKEAKEKKRKEDKEKKEKEKKEKEKKRQEDEEKKEKEKKRKEDEEKKMKEEKEKKRKEDEEKKKKEDKEKKKKEEKEKKRKEEKEKKRKENEERKMKEEKEKKRKEDEEKKMKEEKEKKRKEDEEKKKKEDKLKNRMDAGKVKEGDKVEWKTVKEKTYVEEGTKKGKKKELDDDNDSDEESGDTGSSSEGESAKEQPKASEKKKSALSSSDEDSDNAKPKASRKKNKKKEVKEPPKIDFQVLRWSAVDENVKEICGKSQGLEHHKFYVSSEDLDTAKAAKNASVFSKSLLAAAFTDEALYKCSVSGGQYRAGGRENITQKPALPANVISVIVDVALHRQKAKGWSRGLTKTEIIIGSLRQKFVDVRPKLKNKSEAVTKD